MATAVSAACSSRAARSTTASGATSPSLRQPDGAVELFLDAQSQGKDVGKNTGGPITTDLRALASDQFVAASGKNSPPYFAGSIDEVCLYDRVLTPEEIGVLAGKKE